MKQAYEDGTPAIRTMFFEFTNDEVCWDLKDQYMYGGDILDAPIVYENMLERDVYLRRGAEWPSIYSGDIYDGGQVINVEAPLDTIPVLLKTE